MELRRVDGDSENLKVEAAVKRVAMVYREPSGSTCLNARCVPSKFLIYRAKVAASQGRFKP